MKETTTALWMGDVGVNRMRDRFKVGEREEQGTKNTRRNTKKTLRKKILCKKRRVN